MFTPAVEEDCKEVAVGKKHVIVCMQEENIGTEEEPLVSTINNKVGGGAASSIKAVVRKREIDVLDWDDYFMSIAFLSSKRSKDPSTQVGACIVNEQKRIVGIGYNGFPRGCSDDDLPWGREAEDVNDTKYPYVVHAEVNAILNKNSADCQGCTIFVGLFPCGECAKVIIQAGIREVVYLSDKYHETSTMKASRRLFGLAKVSLRQHSPSTPSVCINFNS
jgi:dCMP deaminase